MAGQTLRPLADLRWEMEAVMVEFVEVRVAIWMFCFDVLIQLDTWTVSGA